MSDSLGVENSVPQMVDMSSHDDEEENQSLPTKVDQDESLSIILFYKYHPLSSSQEIMEPYRRAMESLCQSLELKGRILLGCSDTEGINGTLAGKRDHVRVFTYALLGADHVQQNGAETLDEPTDATFAAILERESRFRPSSPSSRLDDEYSRRFQVVVDNPAPSLS